MKPFALAEGRNVARLAQTRNELLVRLRTDMEYGKKFMDGRDDYTLDEMTRRLDRLIAHQASLPAYVNGDYQVTVDEVDNLPQGWPDMVHLSIRREDRGVIRDWRELQQIKNALVGEENEGFELFPAESRLVDSANQYHLYVFKDAKVRLPFGFTVRHVEDHELSTTKQRKL